MVIIAALYVNVRLPTAMTVMFIVCFCFSVGTLTDYKLGDIVLACNFENAHNDGPNTNCYRVVASTPRSAESYTYRTWLDSNDTSAYDGPTGDHTSGSGM